MKKKTQLKTDSRPTYRELLKENKDLKFLCQVQRLENDNLKADKKIVDVEVKVLRAEAEVANKKINDLIGNLVVNGG